jgi:hypothetical protein
MKLNRKILRKIILQELTLRGGKWGTGDQQHPSRRLRSPLADLPALPPVDTDDDTAVLDMSDETTDMDWERPADIYIDDPAEPTDLEGWDDFWMDKGQEETEVMPSRQPLRHAQRRRRKEDRIVQRAAGELDLELDTEEDTEFTGGAIPSLETPFGFETADQIKQRVNRSADQMSLTREGLQRLIKQELLRYRSLSR